MKPVTVSLLALSFTALATAASAQAKPHAPAYAPLRPVADCLRTDRITEWHVVDPRTITTRNGPNRFLVKLRAACPQLGYGPPILRFESSPANRGTAPFSICGEVGESVRSTQPPSCPIQSVRPIDKATFDKLSAHARRNGSGADQSTQP
ncbi:DUF6491 family protein [Rhodanobacter sp. DHB23]|uniref:DUF6491 family protein n=1 Tax=Rhodanobacter sp. DHB23 TaxID=2775923 RepID=UPI001783C8AB|nr:DUF6491 family protein [Rhodanobacter sp. DHB23]MBD8871723.1 hypothetical protein [Rhodanobacter sp. DHB23]